MLRVPEQRKHKKCSSSRVLCLKKEEKLAVIWNKVVCSYQKKIKKSKMLITAVLWYRVLSCSQLPAKVSSFHLYVVFPSLKGYLFFKYFVLCRGCSWNPLHSTYAFYKNAESLECFCFCCSWCDKAEEKHSEQVLYEQVIEMSTASSVEYVLRLSIWVWQSIHKLQHCFYWGNPTLKLFS